MFRSDKYNSCNKRGKIIKKKKMQFLHELCYQNARVKTWSVGRGFIRKCSWVHYSKVLYHLLVSSVTSLIHHEVLWDCLKLKHICKTVLHLCEFYEVWTCFYFRIIFGNYKLDAREYVFLKTPVSFPWMINFWRYCMCVCACLCPDVHAFPYVVSAAFLYAH